MNIEEIDKGKPSFLLCDSCGAQLLNDYRKCQKCNSHFCNQCGEYFQDFFKNLLPYCPTCQIEPLSEKITPKTSREIESDKGTKKGEKSLPLSDLEWKVRTLPSRTMEVKSQKNIRRNIEVMFKPPISEEQKILNYIQTANVRRIKNKKELFKRLSQILKKEPDYIEDKWLHLSKKYPYLISKVTSRFQDEVLRRQYERANYEALHPKHDKTFDPSTYFLEPSSKKDENLNLKEIKPLDPDMEIEWKQGKMRPIEQKNYRSKFDEQ